MGTAKISGCVIAELEEALRIGDLRRSSQCILALRNTRRDLYPALLGSSSHLRTLFVEQVIAFSYADDEAWSSLGRKNHLMMPGRIRETPLGEIANRLADLIRFAAADCRLENDRHVAVVVRKALERLMPPEQLRFHASAACFVAGIVRDERAVSKRLGLLFEAMSHHSALNTVDLTLAALHHIGLSAATPEGRAAVRLARLSQSGPNHPYHGPQHTREVLINAVMLAGRNNELAVQQPSAGIPYLSQTEMIIQILAALGHDLLHDGASNLVRGKDGTIRRHPYRLERIAADQTRRILEDEGVCQSATDKVVILILSTDPTGAHLAVREAMAFHAGRHVSGDAIGSRTGGVLGSPSSSSYGEPEMNALFQDSRLSHQAAIMSDADLFSSAGISVRYHVLQTTRLGHETARQMDRRSSLYFIDEILHGSFVTPAGCRFNQVVGDIRAFAMDSDAPYPEAWLV